MLIQVNATTAYFTLIFGLTKLLLEKKVKYVLVRNCQTYTSMISFLLLINNILGNKSKCFSLRKFIWLKMLKDLFLNIF